VSSQEVSKFGWPLADWIVGVVAQAWRSLREAPQQERDVDFVSCSLLGNYLPTYHCGNLRLSI